MFTMLSAEKPKDEYLFSDLSMQNNATFTVEKLSMTEEMGKNFSISSQNDIALKKSLPRPTKTPDSFLFKFSIGLIFAFTPVSILY